MINQNPGQTSFDFLQIIVSNQLNEILAAFGTQPDHRFLQAYAQIKRDIFENKLFQGLQQAYQY